MTGKDEDPDARRYAPPIIGILVLAILFWAEALYQVGN